MRVINFEQERNISFVQMILVAAKLIKVDLEEENLYKFAEAVEGKMNVSMSPWLLGKQPTKTRCMATKPKVKGSYIEARIYKQGKINREKPAHKTWSYDQPMSVEITTKEVIKMENTWISNIDPELKAYFESLETSEFPWATPEEICHVL